MDQNTVILSDMIPQQALVQFRVNYYLRKGVTPCADVKVRNPVTEKILVKQVTSKLSEDVLQNRVNAAAETLYRQVRPDFLRCALCENLTLRRYLNLDFAFLKEGFPKAFGEREFSALEQYADALTLELDRCTSADDFLPALHTLNVGSDLELLVLRMVSDSLSELKRLGILSANPLSFYIAEAKKNANRAKAEQQEHTNDALPSYAAMAVLNEFDLHIFNDARYFAVPLNLLGISASTISALNMSDFVTFDDVLSLKIDSEMVRPAVRLCERSLESHPYQVRLLCVDFLRREIDFWREKYNSMGLDLSAKKVPLCAFGCRSQPKRCSPEEIDCFLKELLDRCHPGKHKFTVRAYHKTFLVFGETLLTEKPFHARYLLGRPPETVDERVYISFTDPRLQREMSDLTQSILTRMRNGGVFDNAEI